MMDRHDAHLCQWWQFLTANGEGRWIIHIGWIAVNLSTLECTFSYIKLQKIILWFDYNLSFICFIFWRIDFHYFFWINCTWCWKLYKYVVLFYVMFFSNIGKNFNFIIFLLLILIFWIFILWFLLNGFK